jgi:hypothetical protein
MFLWHAEHLFQLKLFSNIVVDYRFLMFLRCFENAENARTILKKFPKTCMASIAHW